MDKFVEYNKEFIEYIERHQNIKYNKHNDIFEIFCRIAYIIGDSIQN